MKTNKFYDFVYLYLKAILIVAHFSSSLTEPLRGVTIINWPYANKLENGQFEGFCVDILNEIARVARITYTLELAADGKYGGWLQNGSVDGMIGQVYRNETDFAIGDLTALTNRARFVQFTFPFMEFGLSALIHKNYSANIKTFADLISQTDIPYGVKKFGANLPLFTEDPVVSKMFEYMDSHPSSLVNGEKEGIKRVKTSKYAFITESPFNEYVANRDCDLVVIDDNREHFKFEYAIAMQKGSKYHNVISNTLRHLKKVGKLKDLKHKYWKSDNCLISVDQTNDISSDIQSDGKAGNVAEAHSREERDDKKKSDKLKKKKNASNLNHLSLNVLSLIFIAPLFYMRYL